MYAIRFSTFPRTESPPDFLDEIIRVFERHEHEIATRVLKKGLTSNEVLQIIRPGLVDIGFEVERGARKKEKILRPVFFGEQAKPSLQYEIDAWHPKWFAGLEVEAGRAWMGNAIYRDLIQALVLVNLKYLVLAVPNAYRYKSAGKAVSSNDYDNTVAVADALFGQTRIKMPFSLTVVGY